MHGVANIPQSDLCRPRQACLWDMARVSGRPAGFGNGCAGQRERDLRSTLVRPMRVLIVDDHEVVRKGVRSLLLRSGYDVCGEGIDGEDGLAKARELRPDVIVMDVSMPRLNGLEATRRMRGILPDIQVVMLSQHESPEMVG